MCKVKPLNAIRTTKDLDNFCDHNGLPVISINGGHKKRGNKRGAFVMSTHVKDIPIGTMKAIQKQITLLLSTAAIIFLVSVICSMQ